MISSEVTKLDKFTAPYGREVTLENVAYENGVSVLRVHILRVHIREGNRHTVMDIDDGTASSWGAAMLKWANEASQE